MKTLGIVMILAAAGASSFQLPTLVDDDVLEPSVLNEVEHALSRAPTNAPPVVVTNDVFALDGLSATDKAIRLVSAQQADGRWLAGTNDVTSAAVEILSGLLTIEL